MWGHDCLDATHRALLKKGIAEISGDINDDTIRYVREAFLRLISMGSPPITLMITSEGGSDTAALDIVDLIQSYEGDTTGRVCGYARSMAMVLLQACKQRHAMKHSRLRIHHLSAFEIGLDDLRDNEKLQQIRDQLEHQQTKIYDILTKRTGKTEECIRAECEKDRDMDADQALSFGLIDKIIE